MFGAELVANDLEEHNEANDSEHHLEGQVTGCHRCEDHFSFLSFSVRFCLTLILYDTEWDMSSQFLELFGDFY